jgi:hypothetical protein
MRAKQCSQCPYVGTLWKSSPALCKNCAMVYNNTNKEKVATKVCIKAREPIKKVSSKQAKINTAYSVLRLQYLKMFPNCQVSSDDCTHIATQVHHRAGRIGNNMLDTTIWLSVCHTCHELIERNPLWAYEKGYSIKRLNK